MKKILVFLLLLILLCSCGTNSSSLDAKKFKEEYESLNDKKDLNNNDYRKVSIDKDNPFVYSTAEEIVKKIENNDDFYVYFGDKMCPWCRSNIESTVKAAKEKDIKEIFYVDMWDDKKNELVRSKYEVKDSTINKIKDGCDAYYKLLEYLDVYLDEYVLKDENDNELFTGEKRLTLPTYVHFKNGEVVKFTTATSSNQEEANSRLSEEIINDQMKDFKDLFNENNACSFSSKGGC